MKESNLNAILTEAYKQIDETDYDLVWYCGKLKSGLLVTNIYMINDQLKGFGQDLKDEGISLITSQDRISLIWNGTSTFVKYDFPICGYESLSEDIASILIGIQACFDRITAQL